MALVSRNTGSKKSGTVALNYRTGGSTGCGKSSNVLFMSRYYNYRIGLEIKEFWKNISSFFLALLSPIIIGICLMCFVPMEKVVTFGICALVYTIVFCLSMWFWGMNTYEKGA